jgi:hypothetical protein
MTLGVGVDHTGNPHEARSHDPAPRGTQHRRTRAIRAPQWSLSPDHGAIVIGPMGDRDTDALATADTLR